MNNLLKMERYQLVHNRVYWGGILGVFLLGFITADTYVPEVMGPSGGAAQSLVDIFNGMVYDSTFLLILICSILSLILGQEFTWRTISQEICVGHTRQQIFASKIISYLAAFNIMAIVYPVAGCIREYGKFGIGDIGFFFYNVVKAVVYSFVLNSAVFLIAVFCCYWFRNSSKAVAFTAGSTFALRLYLGYGMKLGFPVAFLPTFQVREAISSQAFILPGALIIGAAWIIVLIVLAWNKFCKCDLK